MRTEQEMYDLIINTAKEDERIRAVYMNGYMKKKKAAWKLLRQKRRIFLL